MDTPAQLRPLQNFRDALHLLFPQRADTLLDLLDALSSNLFARSPAELSLNPLFRRTYNSLYDGIQNFGVPAQGTPPVFTRQLLDLIGPLLPAPQRRKFWLFGIDVTPTARPFARCLADRAFVYQPNPIGGNTPITIGHAYSMLAALPEKETPTAPPWVLPLLIQRVDSAHTATQIAVAQTQMLLTRWPAQLQARLAVEVADSAYSGPGFLSPLAAQPDLVIITRARNNRVFYGPPPAPVAEPAPAGHPTWYGVDMRLNAPDTWPLP
jgi:DDE superfamily endonuclease